MHEEHTSDSNAPHDQTASDDPARPQPRMGKIVRDAVSSRLFLMTTLGAASGQLPVLAAEGLLASPAVVVTVALTVVAGVGAFTAAIDEARLDQARGRRVFTATAVLSIVANVAAAAAGVAFSQVATVEHVRYFAALALTIVAIEVAAERSITLPHGLPVPGVVVAVGVVVEVLV